jgi:hypothetical protein
MSCSKLYTKRTSDSPTGPGSAPSQPLTAPPRHERELGPALRGPIERTRSFKLRLRSHARPTSGPLDSPIRKRTREQELWWFSASSSRWCYGTVFVKFDQPALSVNASGRSNGSFCMLHGGLRFRDLHRFGRDLVQTATLQCTYLYRSARIDLPPHPLKVVMRMPLASTWNLCLRSASEIGTALVADVS